MGKLAKSANLQLAFQYTISSVGKAYTKAAASTTTANHVITLAKTLSCELKISTWSTAATSANLWYQSKFLTNIDGNT